MDAEAEFPKRFGNEAEALEMTLHNETERRRLARADGGESLRVHGMGLVSTPPASSVGLTLHFRYAPYETTAALSPLYFARKWIVCSRVNATPTLRSSSCRASTALAAHASGTPACESAVLSASAPTDENRARNTHCSRDLGRKSATACITSKQMFSPSRSQSSHSTSATHPRASCCRWFTTAPLRGCFIVSASKRLSGSPTHDCESVRKSSSYTCPRTAVARCRACFICLNGAVHS
mmetsp:Transcript_2140/g.4463  ORF Transcript_2140/g.4463 Transcript_2140/m.4463 type:complete len:237 (-) Transcript_2140:76-786(-)